MCKTAGSGEAWIERESESSGKKEETGMWKKSLGRSRYQQRCATLHGVWRSKVCRWQNCCMMQMSTDKVCIICGSDNDNCRHSLIECHMARCVWVLLDEDLLAHAMKTQTPGARNWLFIMIQSLQHEGFVKLLVTL